MDLNFGFNGGKFGSDGSGGRGFDRVGIIELGVKDGSGTGVPMFTLNEVSVSLISVVEVIALLLLSWNSLTIDFEENLDPNETNVLDR
ncbi:hypothetical protein GEMRC1_010465 [Eukaryota sp. GEM-RC1]